MERQRAWGTAWALIKGLVMNIFFAIILSYLLGSIPTAYIVGRIYKDIDIRQHGSGNVGASNTFRVLGKKCGIFVLTMDILKGVLALVMIGNLLGVDSVYGRVVLGVAAVCGHNWTIFLEFQGGKGIATSLGVLIGLTISFSQLVPVLLACLFSWIVTLYFSRYISLSSMVAACVLPVAMLITSQPFEMICLGALFCVFVVYRHKSNITRLMGGTESKVPFFEKKQGK